MVLHQGRRRKTAGGCFEPKAKPRSLDSIPEDFSFGQFPEDWDHFEPAMMNAIHRVPKLEEAGIQLFLMARKVSPG